MSGSIDLGGAEDGLYLKFCTQWLYKQQRGEIKEPIIQRVAMETSEDHNKLAKTQSICSVYENLFKCATQPNKIGASVDQEMFPFII